MGKIKLVIELLQDLFSFYFQFLLQFFVKMVKLVIVTNFLHEYI